MVFLTQSSSTSLHPYLKTGKLNSEQDALLIPWLSSVSHYITPNKKKTKAKIAEVHLRIRKVFKPIPFGWNFWFISLDPASLVGVTAPPNDPTSLSSFSIPLLLHIFQADPICSCSLWASVVTKVCNRPGEQHETITRLVTYILSFAAEKWMASTRECSFVLSDGSYFVAWINGNFIFTNGQ